MRFRYNGEPVPRVSSNPRVQLCVFARNEKRQTETAVYNSDFIRRLIRARRGRESFKRSFSTAEHKIGDQLAFLFARDEPVITVLRHHCGGIISVL